MEKYLCDCCYRGMTFEEVLRAPNPFTEGETLAACPHCKEVNRLSPACDDPDCWNLASGGWPTKEGGYRQTCHKHFTPDV